MAGAESARRIFVSGLARTAVERYDGGIVEEDNLGWFFHNRGCRIDDVRLMVDPGTGRCRGFGFVDFEDDESFQKALTFSGSQDLENIKLDPHSGGRLRVEVAKPADPSAKEKQRELVQVRDQTEGLARALRLREARVRELERELKMSRDRQQKLDQQHALEAQISRERAHQEEIRRADRKLAELEARLTAKLREEEDRTRALEAMVTGTDGEQTRRHVAERTAEHAGHAGHGDHPGHDGHAHRPEHSDRAAHLAGDSDPAGAADLAHGTIVQAGAAGSDGSASGADLMVPVAVDDTGSGDPVLRIKNTFIEYCLPPDMEPLVRTKTAPAIYVPAPWAIKRETSAILRSILDDKMDEADGEDEVRENLARAKSREEVAEPLPMCVGTPETGPVVGDSGGSTWGRVVRIRNLPLLEPAELEEGLREELARLWLAGRGAEPPEVEEIRLAPASASATSYAARTAGTEATLRFARTEDAAWLVDGRRPGSWSSLETMSLRGRVLQAEWPAAPPPADWRRLRYKADTDASSEVSYATAGTRQSFSSAVARFVAGTGGGSVAAPAPAVAAAQGDSEKEQPGVERPGSRAENPAANRTVLLVGLSPTLPVHTVRAEVIGLLKRLWQRGGFQFDPEKDLHRGAMGGLVIRPARRPGEENDGSCLVRLRNYADAKWLVEQARGLHIEGRPLRAMWARPRC